MADLVNTYESLPLGTTDASVVAIAERLGLTEVATLDRRHPSAFKALRIGRLRSLIRAHPLP
jgi:predicted nucleic acid-binding protein